MLEYGEKRNESVENEYIYCIVCVQLFFTKCKKLAWNFRHKFGDVFLILVGSFVLSLAAVDEEW